MSSILEQMKLELEKPERPKAPPKAEAKREVGIARAASGKEELVQVARRIAREKAANGPITIEDVCDDMAAQGYPVWAGSKDNPQNWKGSVFNTPEFVCVGNMPSRKASNNGRHVRQWALKSWLRDNHLNGTSGSKSSFDFMGIYNDYLYMNRGVNVDTDKLVWIVGRELLEPHFAATVNKNRLFGVDLVSVFNGVGAVLIEKKALDEIVVNRLCELSDDDIRRIRARRVKCVSANS